MKKILLFLSVCLAAFVADAQSYESIKNMVILTQYKKAKEDLDKAMLTAKFAGKPEAYILKTLVYSTLSMDETMKNTAAGDQLADEGEAAFKKYKEMDPSMSLIGDLVYQNGPINLYSSYYSSGYNDYSGKKWDAAFAKLKKAVVYSDLLIEKKLLTASIDTNVLILAGITAEKSNNKADAALYYSRLADKKITGDGFESVYRFLVSYFFGKKDYVSFEKYKAIGKELYPNSEFFVFDKIDFAVGLETTLAGKVKAVEEVLATDPNNFKANEWMGEIIYRAFYPLKDDVPEAFDTVAFELKMVNAFNKAGNAQPDSIDAFLYLGDHFYNKSEIINDQRAAHAADMKRRTKPGTMASKEDIAKRDLLDKQYGEALETERIPYEKAAVIFAAKTTLGIREKAQYRNLAGKIADVYTFKKIQAKGKPAEVAKYEAEEKKWNERYESIGKTPSNIEAITSKVGVIKMQVRSGGTYEVPCELNGLKMNFIFDSGASDVSISLTEATFMLKNGYLKPEDIVDIEKYRIANGQLEEGFVINIRELKIGNYLLKNVRGSIVKSNTAPLLLGMSAIKKLGFKFDPSQGTLFK